jgi:predicted metal-dependent HD superfamily phosphohydrolase
MREEKITSEDFGCWVSSLPPEWTRGCREALFEAAYKCYQSPGRVYHAWSHVVDCADKLRTFPCGSGRTVFLALLFHDVIYVPGDPKNEKLSAEHAAFALKQYSSIPDNEIAEIGRFILATKHHRVPPGEESADLCITLDIDMSILGSSPEAYQAYADGVRREYCPAVTSEALFTAGRIAFLSKVLAQPSIFHSEEGRARWGSAARLNITKELDSLRASQGLLSRLTAWLGSLAAR